MNTATRRRPNYDGQPPRWSICTCFLFGNFPFDFRLVEWLLWCSYWFLFYPHGMHCSINTEYYNVSLTLPHFPQLVIESHSPSQRSMTNDFKEALLNNHCWGNEVRVPQSKERAVFSNLK